MRKINPSICFLNMNCDQGIISLNVKESKIIVSQSENCIT